MVVLVALTAILIVQVMTINIYILAVLVVWMLVTRKSSYLGNDYRSDTKVVVVEIGVKMILDVILVPVYFGYSCTERGRDAGVVIMIKIRVMD